MLFATAVYQFNHFVGTLLATRLSEGSVSWLYYADRLVQFPLGVFAIAISTAALPSLSLQATAAGLEEFRKTLAYAFRLVVFITLPSMAGLMVLGPAIIRVIFERGTFEALDTAMSYQALLFYCVGLLAFSGIRVIVSGFFALKDTKTPVRAAAVAAVANVAFSLLLMGPLKHGGLALALSLASMVQLGLLTYYMSRRVRGWEIRRIVRSSIISLVASCIMGGILLAAYRWWWNPGPQAGTLELIVGISLLVALGALMYFALCRLMGSEEMSSLVSLIRKKSGR
jgi:putative peptidoglycan lipid II flippase